MLDFASARLKADVELLLEAVASYKPDLLDFSLDTIQFVLPKTIRQLFAGGTSPMHYTTVRSLVNDSAATQPPLIRHPAATQSPYSQPPIVTAHHRHLLPQRSCPTELDRRGPGLWQPCDEGGRAIWLPWRLGHRQFAKG